MNFYEHQSTDCPNMPLRFLFYVTNSLRKITKMMELDYTFERRIELIKRDYEKQGIQQGIQQSIQRLLDHGFTKEQILELGYTEEDFNNMNSVS